MSCKLNAVRGAGCALRPSLAVRPFSSFASPSQRVRAAHSSALEASRLHDQLDASPCSSSTGSSSSSSAATQPAASVATQSRSGLAPALALSAAALALLTAQPSLAAVAGADVDPALAHAAEVVLRPLFGVFNFLYIIRIPMTWYPDLDGTKMPWALSYYPTEPVLSATRKVCQSPCPAAYQRRILCTAVCPPNCAPSL